MSAEPVAVSLDEEKIVEIINFARHAVAKSDPVLPADAVNIWLACVAVEACAMQFLGAKVVRQVFDQGGNRRAAEFGATIAQRWMAQAQAKKVTRQ